LKRQVPWPRSRSRDITCWVGEWCWCWRYFPGRGLSIPVVVPLPPGARTKGFKPGREVFGAMKMPQAEGQATAGDVIPLPESVVLKKFPLLAELLLVPVWEEGQHKGQRSAMFFFEGSIAKCLLKIEKQKLKSMVSARSFDELLSGIETLLRSGNMPWEQEQPPQEKPKKKRG